MKNEQKLFKLSFPAKGAYISPARMAISSLAAQADFSVQDIQEIKKMFSEACRSAIEQAYAHHPEKRQSLNVECSVEDSRMNIAIHAKGVKIDLQKERSA